MVESSQTSGIEAWVFLFSRFTPEALFFEVILFLFLIALYTSFWVLRKRKYGVIDTSIPAGPVKTYLNDLIMEAEGLRLQLFGLLSAGNISAKTAFEAVGLEEGTMSNPLSQKLADLEVRFNSQSQSLSTMMIEKNRLESALEEAKSKAALALVAAATSTTTNSENEAAVAQVAAQALKSDAMTQELQMKVKSLEAMLAEYNLLEDDLANLKRLQMENQDLKSKLANQNESLKASIAASAPSPAGPAMPSQAAQSSPRVAEQKSTAPEVSAANQAVINSMQSELDHALDVVLDPKSPSTTATKKQEANPLVDEALAQMELADEMEKKTSDKNQPMDPSAGEDDLVAEFEKILKS